MRALPLSIFPATSRLLASLLAAATLLLAACGKAPASAPAGGKILLYGNETEPQDLDPHITTGVPESRIIGALFEGLVTHHPSGEGVSPGVAERWETSPDGLVWTFHLRADARWSNGDLVTASDFLRSFRRILSPSLGAEYAYKLHHVTGAEEFNKGELTDFAQTGFSAPDERTLVLRLKHRVPYLLEALKHHSWFPVHLPSIEKHGPADRKGGAWTRPGRLVGNGPFTLESWRPNQVITVHRSPTYWNAPATRLDGIAFYAIDDKKTEERMFRSGQLHVTGSVPPERIPTYRAEQSSLLRIDPYYATYFYRINTTRAPLDDARVRRALALAIDRRAIIDTILRGDQEPALHFTPPLADFTPGDTLSGDADEARRLLAEAGFPDGRGLRRIELLYNTSETHKSVAEAIQQMWKTRLGVDAVLRNEEWKVYLDTIDNGRYDIARAGWIGDYPDPHTFLDLWTTGGGNNDTGYANPDYDRLLASALEAPDEPARMAIYRRLDSLLSRDAPIIPIYFYKRVYLLSPKVRNWVPNLLDNRGWQYIDLAPAADAPGT
jgi:oligopeptide transport system substrate-binding protein